MGIEMHGFHFLHYARKFGSFNQTLTIGRQGLHVDESYVRKCLKLKADYRHSTYCEELLKDQFGSSVVDSVDHSDFENASLVFNMNYPPPVHLQGKYDTVFDGGCLEHIYNIPQALKNLSLMCKKGGQIIHVLPANNFCGHGFWQFSPELFFSMYSTSNGYSDTEVFVADASKHSKWYKVHPPYNGKRVTIRSNAPLYVLVRTVLQKEDFSHADIQQSDYVHEWSNHSTTKTPKRKHPFYYPLRHGLAAIPVVKHVSHSLRRFYRNRIRYGRSELLNARNPGLHEIKVSAFLS